MGPEPDEIGRACNIWLSLQAIQEVVPAFYDPPGLVDVILVLRKSILRHARAIWTDTSPLYSIAAVMLAAKAGIPIVHAGGTSDVMSDDVLDLEFLLSDVNSLLEVKVSQSYRVVWRKTCNDQLRLFPAER